MNNTLLTCLFVFLSAPIFAQQWTARKPMLTPRAGMGVVASEGKIYTIGGINTTGITIVTTNEVYDPATDTWSKLANMSTRRMDMGIAAVAGKIYVIGGEKT